MGIVHILTELQCLPDMLEAYLGAIFVDSGFDFTVIEAFFQRHILPFFHDMSIYDTFANRHPTVRSSPAPDIIPFVLIDHRRSSIVK
jgi:dsRNA-specific ribonuclease